MAKNENDSPVGSIPHHLAVIMDGNGRWANQRGLPRHFGHRMGVDAVRTIVKAARSHGIKYLTLYSFSTENWSRPEEEVNELFKLLKMFIRRDLAELHQNNVCIRVIGERSNLPKDIDGLLNEAETLTQDNTAQTLIIAFNYGARQEISNAVKLIAEKVKSGELDISDIDADEISRNLYTHDIPDPDLILRTAGELRLSNFLMWQASYSEFAFVDKLWPDFTPEDLATVLANYALRRRKFGGLEGSETETKTAGKAGS